jgi:methylmalonic aciduria homocystinuria type C protein
MDAAARDSFRAGCEEAGLDVVQPFRVDWFNAAVEPSLRLPDWGRNSTLGIVVGNTRRLWRPFTNAIFNDPELIQRDHPLDTYVETALTDITGRCIGARQVTLWAHQTVPSAIPIQRIAEASGLAYLSPSHLSIHPAFGPWLALRAVVVVDTDGPPGEAPRAPDPCARCAKPCLEPLAQALALSPDVGRGDVERNWRAWALVREVCPEGHAYRYDDEQLRYHYVKDRSILRTLPR